MKDLIACCGLDCENCDARKATVNNDDALRKKTAKQWAEANDAPIKPEHINCMGCRTAGDVRRLQRQASSISVVAYGIIPATQESPCDGLVSALIVQQYF